MKVGMFVFFNCPHFSKALELRQSTSDLWDPLNSSLNCFSNLSGQRNSLRFDPHPKNPHLLDSKETRLSFQISEAVTGQSLLEEKSVRQGVWSDTPFPPAPGSFSAAPPLARRRFVSCARAGAHLNPVGAQPEWTRGMNRSGAGAALSWVFSTGTSRPRT